MNRILPLAVVLLLVISGCSDKPISWPESWDPTAKELLRAEEIARQYARNELKVAEAQLSRMKVVATGWYEDERKVLEF